MGLPLNWLTGQYRVGPRSGLKLSKAAGLFVAPNVPVKSLPGMSPCAWALAAILIAAMVAAAAINAFAYDVAKTNDENGML
ncbi:MAG: hypothetical protein O7C63_04185 [Alphaproteobacteria bacterium]|nr:hypothetical protein [Alphaproteobacteria bacterium]MCZ6764116.1 hypothetical protein [Alphaproteobacteria bacterium]